MKFFAVSPPGLEPALQWEIDFWWKMLSPVSIEQKRVKGGIEIDAPIEFVEMNRWLKTPSRILMRICEFELDKYQTLTGQLKNLELPVTLKKGKTAFHISAKSSRCAHKERLIKSCESAYLKLDATFHIRVLDDRAGISLDTSGEHLHKRGYKTQSGKAPIRENLASGLVLSELKKEPLSHWQGVQFFDPMMGSGTLISECAGLFSQIQGRKFDFEKWHQSSLIMPGFQPPHWHFAGADIDAKEVSAASTNWGGDTVQYKEEDLMSDSSEICLEREKLWIVSNLPYGERVKSSWRDKINRCAEKFDPWRMSFAVPKVKPTDRFAIRGFRLQSVLNFSNGGIPVSWLSFIKNK